jgi:hypothetical protein
MGSWTWQAGASSVSLADRVNIFLKTPNAAERVD